MFDVRSFQYAKYNDKETLTGISDRVLLVSEDGDKFIEGTDLTELLDTDIQAYNKLMAGLAVIEAEARIAKEELLGQFDLKYRYRRFLKKNIINEEKV